MSDLMNFDYVRLLKRVFVYALGLFFLAMGVAFSINSRLGVSPVNSLPYIISLVSGIELGTVVMIVFSVFLFLQIVILRKEFKIINLTQLLFSILFGYFVDFAKILLGNFSLPSYAGQLVMLAVSILFVAIGVVLYVNAQLVNMPMEGLTMAVRDRFLVNKTFADAKVIMDSTVVALGMILSLLFLGNVTGIREGTILCALLVGKLMKPLQRVLVPYIRKVGC